MNEHITIAIRTTLVLLIIVSGIYPALVWTIGQLAFRHEANGSLMIREGRPRGGNASFICGDGTAIMTVMIGGTRRLCLSRGGRRAIVTGLSQGG